MPATLDGERDVMGINHVKSIDNVSGIATLYHNRRIPLSSGIPQRDRLVVDIITWKDASVTKGMFKLRYNGF